MSDFFDLTADQQAHRLTILAQSQLAHWGDGAELVRLIKFRENAVFEVSLKGGQRGALRIHRQGYHSSASLQSELQWMDALTHRGLQVPYAIPTTRGDRFVEAQIPEARGAWLIDVLSWLDGHMLGEIGEPLALADHRTEPVFNSIGRTMAELHIASMAFSERGEQPRHHWDSSGFIGDDPLWGPFWELDALTEGQREFFNAVRSVLASDLASYARFDHNYGLIHADMVPENVLLDGDDIKLIDFDDAGYGWFVFDIVTALFWLQEEPQFELMRRSLLNGYQSVRPLSETDLDALPLFFALRSTTYMGWVHTRRNTETAQALTPMIIELAEHMCRQYMERR